jgi:hypothetical protein
LSGIAIATATLRASSPSESPGWTTMQCRGAGAASSSAGGGLTSALRLATSAAIGKSLSRTGETVAG